MATTIPVVTVAGAAPVATAALTAPTTNETVVNVGPLTILELVIGGTATTPTLVRPSNYQQGDAVEDLALGAALLNTRRFVRLFPYSDTPGVAGGNVNLLLDQVAGVTARIWQV